MGIETVVAGAYNSTWNSVAIGMTMQGYKIQRQNHQEVINQSDLYGDTIIDTVYRGGDTFVDWISRIYSSATPISNVMPAAISPFWPFGAGLGTLWTAAAPIARLGSALARSLVLTAVASTPAAALPATLTASKSILAPGFNGELLFDSRARNVPMRMLCLPTESSGTGTCLAMT